MHRKNMAILNRTTSLGRDLDAFPGAFQGTGAQQSVISKRQALAYFKQQTIRYTMKPSLTKFKLGNGIFS